MRHLANGLTICRILLSPILLCVPPFTRLFYTVYMLCGLSDMLDGPIARKTGTDSPIGALLDSIADLVFFLSCLISLFPAVALQRWIWGWIAGIAMIKICNLISGFVYQKRFVMLHTKANQLTGMMLFVFPFCLPLVNIHLAAIPVCAAATFAAVQEGHFIRTGRCG